MLVAFVLVLLSGQGATAQTLDGEDMEALIGLIRQEKFAVADGISHTDYMKLVDALGPVYSGRIVSAEDVIVEYLAGRVMSEIVLYGQLNKIAKARILDEFAKMVPGVTRLSDVDGNIFVRDFDGNEENNSDYVIHGGDLIGLINGADAAGYSTHISEIAYVLREGETAVPPEVERIHAATLSSSSSFEASASILSTTSFSGAMRWSPFMPRKITAARNATRLLPSRKGWFEQMPKAYAAARRGRSVSGLYAHRCLAHARADSKAFSSRTPISPPCSLI